MNNFTINTYEMKREIEKFSKKVTENLDKCQKSLLWICNMECQKAKVV